MSVFRDKFATQSDGLGGAAAGAGGTNELFFVDADQENFPNTNYAVGGERGDGEPSHPTMKFDSGTEKFIILVGFVPSNYVTGDDLDFTHGWTSSATSGDAIWGVSVERNNAGFNIDTASWGTEATATGTAPTTDGDRVETSVTIPGSSLQSLEPGEKIRLRLARKAAAVGDDMAADGEHLDAWLSLAA